MINPNPIIMALFHSNCIRFAALNCDHTTQLHHTLIQISTGHSSLNGFLHKIKVAQDSLCQCKSESETVDHFLLRCPILHQTRLPLRNNCVVKSGCLPPPLYQLIADKSLFCSLANFIGLAKRLNFV